MRRYSVPLSIGLALVVLAVALRAGPLDPPAGPITPSYKTLTEVEPRTLINSANTPGDATSVYKITQPGSYYLAGDLLGVTGKNGILITTSRVSIDLRGFHVVGVAGSLRGIATGTGAATDISITNGSVSSWGQWGIDLAAIPATACRLSHLTLASNGSGGFRVASDAEITRCIASFNTGDGFFSDYGVIFSQCGAYSNSDSGFDSTWSCSFDGCTAQLNTFTGFRVIALCNLTGCIAWDNQAEGIRVGSGSTVNGCTATGNSTNGISAIDGSLIINNACHQNGDNSGSGAGIYISGSDNRIEGNNCTLADRGIQVLTAGNIIIRNTCADNTTDWVLAANNVFGAIVDRRAPASAGVNGFSALSSAVSTDPWANFSY